jgi:hypothetical protein
MLGVNRSAIDREIKAITVSIGIAVQNFMRVIQHKKNILKDALDA